MKLLAALIATLLISSNYAVEYTVYDQCDEKWKKDLLPGGQSICQLGAILTCVSMVLTTLNRPCRASPCTPKALNTWLKQTGEAQGNLFPWGAVRALGLTYAGQSRDKAAIIEHVNKGDIVLLNTDRGAHWVLVKGYKEGQGFEVIDPQPIGKGRRPIGLAAIFKNTPQSSSSPQ